MTEQNEPGPYVDPAHRLPDADWGKVRREANRLRAEHEAEHGAPEPPADLMDQLRAAGEVD